jgi:uncharacterized membrane protein YfcA
MSATATGDTMILTLTQLTGLPSAQLAFVVAAVFMAGLARGFSGFGLSAVVMASLVVIIPSVELIPVCFLLECAASVAMFRGGMAMADMRVVWALVTSSSVGVPVGLMATTSIDVSLSQKIALSIILCLTLVQFFNLRPSFLATRGGLYLSGVTAGIATGLASVGGMVIALYVLASGAPPKQMRASLVMFLAITMVTSLVFLIAYDLLTMQALWRGALMIPLVLLGVFSGARLFRPAYEHLYKAACLGLLALLSAAGLISQVF